MACWQDEVKGKNSWYGLICHKSQFIKVFETDGLHTGRSLRRGGRRSGRARGECRGGNSWRLGQLVLDVAWLGGRNGVLNGTHRFKTKQKKIKVETRVPLGNPSRPPKRQRLYLIASTRLSEAQAALPCLIVNCFCTPTPPSTRCFACRSERSVCSQSVSNTFIKLRFVANQPP